ncbi:ABC transporter permease [Robiginitomaculum antarcticum]|uniref:ABC transporter permease n=1 Tax=Robiginitomaculum antarcticum TaxID=437507 RepID=UPI00037F86E2|nr:ABC transporter permease [Robiginitomaculum antarcticum]
MIKRLYAFQDLGRALRDIKALSAIAAKQIQIENRRNFLGLAWLVISFAVPTTGIGWLLAELQGLPLNQHIPHVAFGFVAWNFVSACITEGCHIFYRNRSMLLQAPLPRSGFVISLVFKKLFLLAFQLATACMIAATFGWRPNIFMLFVPVSILIYFFTAVGAVLVVSIISARIRDFSEIAASVIRLSFFFTPIIWSTSSRSMAQSSALDIVARLNPLTYYVNLLRDPAQGHFPDALTFGITIGIATFLICSGLLLLQKNGKKIVFYI